MSSVDQVSINSVEALATNIGERSSGDRILIAIAGPPGSGKSTISELLQTELNSAQQLTTQIVPMDGFHYDNSILRERDLLSRKGAPNTFDVDGLQNVLMRLVSSPVADVVVPVFDRENDLSRAGARAIRSSSRVVIIEGNYLLLDTAPWNFLKRYFSASVMIRTEESILQKRLIDRWLSLDFSEHEARLKVADNDMPNAMTVMSHSVPSDLTFFNDTP